MNDNLYNSMLAQLDTMKAINSMTAKFETKAKKEEYTYLKSGNRLIPLFVFVKLDGELVPLQASLKG